MEGDPPTGSVFGVGAFGSSIDGGTSAGGANQRLLVPVCGDQYERLWRPVLLHAPTSHSRPFRGVGGTEVANPTLRECTTKSKVAQSFGSHAGRETWVGLPSLFSVSCCC